MGGWDVPTVHLTQPVGKKGQRPFRGQTRVELPDAARRAVTGIDQGGQSRGALPGVVAFEVRAAHVRFAAYFQNLGRGALQPERHGPDGAHILSDILAGLAIATGGCQDQCALFVAQADGQAVEFQLAGVLDRFRIVAQIQLAPHLGIKGHRAVRASVGFGADGQHRNPMSHRYECRQRFATHSPGRRIDGDQLRMGGFQLLKLLKQPVVLGVGNFRIVQHIVAVAMPVEPLAQPSSPMLRIGERRHVALAPSERLCAPLPLQLGDFVAQARERLIGHPVALLVTNQPAQPLSQLVGGNDQQVQCLHFLKRSG
jgi:hypothetical protein